MKLHYDPVAGAAYLALPDIIADGEVAETLVAIQTPGGKGELNIDFDAEGRLLGIEILGARDLIAPEVLERAEGY
ncbi:DUF2283 domain-containing protein [Rothia sp. AR01]|uniref:DUF2283 domain-containing protein n=1 Tax=Rothia santali TaxID=2949643 RepID=A0A9X2HHA8_9MICC|nr:DUF2283 domain-containing protein [Rothia santali]MCP3425686.1 DUF2283 domain-containing protein [Rothia santali]